MALFLKQDNNRSALQERLATELQERAKQKAAEHDLPDGVSDSNYIKNTKQTTTLAGVWIAIAVISVVLVVAMIFLTAQ